MIANLLDSFSFIDSEIILLHVLRNKGIGDWGSSFIQWDESANCDEHLLEHYVFSLSCLLSPVQELELRAKSRLESITYLEEQLKRLERENWIVVYDKDLPEDVASRRSNSRFNLISTVLLENDYLALLAQFKVTEIFKSHCQSFSAENETNESFPIRSLSIAHHIMLILIRGIYILPKDFIQLIRHLGYMISSVATILGESLVKYKSIDGEIWFSDNLQSTVALEMDAFIERIFCRLVQIREREIWEFVSLLPFDKCTISGKAKIGQVFLTFLQTFESHMKSQIGYICIALQNFILAPTCTKSIEEVLEKWDLTILELVKCVYNFTFIDLDWHDAFIQIGQKFLKDILSEKSDLLSSFLSWIRDDYDKIDRDEIKEFYSDLPWESLHLKSSDLVLIQSMLLDPENSIKAQIAMLVLEKLNWGYAKDSETLFLPRHIHREIGNISKYCNISSKDCEFIPR